MTKRQAEEGAVVSEPKRSRVEVLEGAAYSDDEYDDTASNSGSAATAGAETVLTGQTSLTTRSRKFPSDLKTIPCTHPGCHKTFNRPARLAAHLRSHTDDRPFKCEYPGCDKTYREEKHLRQHVKGSHTEERSYACDHEGCAKSFLTATRLRRHQAVHAGQERFRCRDYPPCNLSFRKHNTLQRHIRSEHLGGPAYPCPEPGCGAGFDSQGALRNHTRREHAEPQFWCEECSGDGDGDGAGLGFTSFSLLQAHINREHRKCSFCDFKCTGQRELERHYDIHHSGKPAESRKDIACPWEGCSKKFTKNANLNVHIRTAHEGFRFVCGEVDVSGTADLEVWSNDQGCGGGFVTKANLEDHIRYVHIGLKRPQPTKPQASLIDDIAGTKRDVKCTVEGCSARFIRYHDLQVHLEDHPQIDAAAAAPQVDQIDAAILSLAGTDDADAAPFGEDRIMPELPLYGIIPGVTDCVVQDQVGEDFWLAAGEDFESPPQTWQDDEAAMRQLIDEPFAWPVDPALGEIA